MTGDELDRGHVELIDIGPFLAIDLDANAQAVHLCRDCFYFEALPFHDVAPVTRGVAN